VPGVSPLIRMPTVHAYRAGPLRNAGPPLSAWWSYRSEYSSSQLTVTQVDGGSAWVLSFFPAETYSGMSSSSFCAGALLYSALPVLVTSLYNTLPGHEVEMKSRCPRIRDATPLPRSQARNSWNARSWAAVGCSPSPLMKVHEVQVELPPGWAACW